MIENMGAGEMSEDRFFTYRLLDQLFPKSFKLKVFFVAFISTHIPLIALAVYIFLYSASEHSMLLPLMLVIASTVIASIVSIQLLRHLLGPLFACVRVIKEAQENNVYHDLPEEYKDELGYLMEQLNKFMNLHRNLQVALEKADTANREKDNFVSVINHELRTPLTSLNGAIALALNDQVGADGDRVRSLLEIAERNSSRLSKLVDNILLAQKIDIDALELDETVIDIGRVLKDSFEENKTFSSKCHLEIFDDSLKNPPFIIGDEFAVRQIIDNMVSNAIKFSEKGDTVRGKISEDHGKVRVSIIDSGEGIPDGMEGVVFGRFEQVKNKKQGSTQGTGLGLHISRKLAGKMSGNLSYKSELGVGTEFYLEFEKADAQ